MASKISLQNLKIEEYFKFTLIKHIIYNNVNIISKINNF